MISKSESQIYFAFFFKIMKDKSKHVLEETLISLDKWLHHPFNYVQMNTFLFKSFTASIPKDLHHNQKGSKSFNETYFFKHQP